MNAVFPCTIQDKKKPPNTETSCHALAGILSAGRKLKSGGKTRKQMLCSHTVFSVFKHACFVFGFMLVFASAGVAADNEVENPSLEQGDWDPDGWELPDKSVYAYDYSWEDSGAHSGQRCLKVGKFFDSTSWEYLEWGPKQRFAVDPSKTYLLSFWHRIEPGIYLYSMQVRLAWVTEWSVNGRDTIKSEHIVTYQRGWVDTQADRATVYGNVISQLVNTPYMLGAKFFTWHNFSSPSPAYGFKNYGIFDRFNRPYQPLVDEITRVNRKVATFNRAKIRDPDPKWHDRVYPGSHLVGINWLLRRNMKRKNR